MMNVKTSGTIDCAYVDQYPVLKEWLTKHAGHCHWQLPSDPKNLAVSSYIEGWLVNTVLVIVLIHPDGYGWEIFTPCTDPDIAVSLADAEKRCGIA